MAAVLLTWLPLCLIFSGLGLLALRLLWQTPQGMRSLFDSFWLGWALTLGLAQLWHFALPVNDIFLSLLAVAALLPLFWHRWALACLTRRLLQDRLFILLLSLLALWLANRALAMPTAYDTGFRDMQAVLWLDSYPLVPGLGNLFSSLAMNQSIYLYDALLDAFFWSGRSHHIALGLLLLVYLAYALKAVLSVCRARNAAELRWSWVFASATLPYAFYTAVPTGGITHFLTDSAVDIVGFVSMIYFLDFLQDQQADGARANYLVYRLALVILVGFTIKQSFFVFGLAIGMFTFLTWLKRQDAPLAASHLTRACLPVALMALALLLPWMARGVASSGYIAYPQSVGRMAVDWAIPVEEAPASSVEYVGQYTIARRRAGACAGILGLAGSLAARLRRQCHAQHAANADNGWRAGLGALRRMALPRATTRATLEPLEPCAAAGQHPDLVSNLSRTQVRALPVLEPGGIGSYPRIWLLAGAAAGTAQVPAAGCGWHLSGIQRIFHGAYRYLAAAGWGGRRLPCTPAKRACGIRHRERFGRECAGGAATVLAHPAALHALSEPQFGSARAGRIAPRVPPGRSWGIDERCLMPRQLPQRSHL